jgi:predicted ATP-dependent endonuclease of OLD family
MHIEKIKIKNFKCYENFEVFLNSGLNIIVGNNEAGKSTILYYTILITNEFLVIWGRFQD